MVNDPSSWIDGLNNGLSFFLTAGGVLAAVILFVRRAEKDGLDGLDYFLIMGLLSASALWLFVILRAASPQIP
jgi:hypothetical protein